ncbi:MAG: PH domain-containing protein [Anaerolineae bacterium]|nr:PH domain-containing protein [Anaerolineae bacterium]
MDWYNEQYIITNRRVMSVQGVINKHVSDSALEKVNDVVLEQSALGRILGYGNVEIITGSDIGANLFHRIAQPVRFKTMMLNQKSELVRSQPQQPTPTPTPQTAPPALAEEEPTPQNIPELIRKLDALRQQGVLTEEEFQAKKAELLERL